MLESLLYPKAVAVMGASRTPGKVGYAVVANLIQGGFEGDIVPVNPSGGEMLGQKFYTSLEEYGKPIDLSVIAVPTAAVKGAVDLLAPSKAPRPSWSSPPASKKWARRAPPRARDRRPLPRRRAPASWAPTAWASSTRTTR